MVCEQGSRSLERARHAVNDVQAAQEKMARKILSAIGMIAVVYGLGATIKSDQFDTADTAGVTDIIPVQNDVALSVDRIVNPEIPVMRPTRDFEIPELRGLFFTSDPPMPLRRVDSLPSVQSNESPAEASESQQEGGANVPNEAPLFTLLKSLIVPGRYNPRKPKNIDYITGT